jgi:hypothetical protein
LNFVAELNGQFQKAFSEKTNISNEEFQIQCKMTGTFNTIKDINITENGVHKLLKNLNPNKAAGPDNITPRVLKELATHIAPILTILVYQPFLLAQSAKFHLI